MTGEIVAYCGLVCSECPAYKATATDDQNLRNKIAKEWSTPEFPMKPNDINCDGCSTIDGPILSFCLVCPTRKCAMEKEVETCAHCADYICEILDKHFSQLDDKTRSAMQNKLEKIRETI